MNNIIIAIKDSAPLLLIIVLVMFIVFRSQRKKSNARQKMLNSIINGDKIITIGGIIATIITINKNDIITIKTANNTNIDLKRDAIYMIVKDDTNKNNN